MTTPRLRCSIDSLRCTALMMKAQCYHLLYSNNRCDMARLDKLLAARAYVNKLVRYYKNEQV